MVKIYSNPPRLAPILLGIWALGATGGPVLGPIIGAFAAVAKGWRWPLWELGWISGFTAFFLALFLPETLPGAILLKRARRLRTLTGNDRLRSMSEIEQVGMSVREIAAIYLIRPFRLLLEPAVFYIDLYVGRKWYTLVHNTLHASADEFNFNHSVLCLILPLV